MHWMREYHKQVLLGLKFLLSRGLPLVLVSAATAGVSGRTGQSRAGRDVQHLHQPGYPDDQRQSGSGAAGGKYSGQSPSDERHPEPG